MKPCLRNTAKNTVFSSNFLVWKFCGKAQLPHSFRRFAVPFHKISAHQEIRGKYGIFRSGKFKIPVSNFSLCIEKTWILQHQHLRQAKMNFSLFLFHHLFSFKSIYLLTGFTWWSRHIKIFGSSPRLPWLSKVTANLKFYL